MFTRKKMAENFAALLIFLFLYTGVTKYIDFVRFHRVLGQTPLIQSFAGFIAYALPGFEILVAALLVFPKTRLRGFWLASLLMSLLTLYLIYMVIFTSKLPCSCGGVLEHLTWKQHIFFNLAFVAIAWTGMWMQRRLVRDDGEESNQKAPPIAYQNS